METNLIQKLQDALGVNNVSTRQRQTEHYLRGFRSGSGAALAVVFPNTLLQLWEVLKLCVESNTIIIMQGANTGLTEGSTPNGDDYDREIVVINTLKMDQIILLNQGEQILSFSGATLHKLEKILAPLNRAPHSVLGSSCIGASIIGGIANNSGGALVKRGPAYTELSLYARVNKKGELELVNHLGIDLGDTPEIILERLEAQNFITTDIGKHGKLASDQQYADRLRDINADTPARFNADKRRLYESSGCAGKIAIFAVRLDTFPIPKKEKTFYIGTNDPKILAQVRRDILGGFKHLPEVAEYLHRDTFDIAEKYGKDTFLTIQYFGTKILPKLFSFKSRTDAVLNKIPFLANYLGDRMLQFLSQLFPKHLPNRISVYRDRYEHHLILKMSDEGITEADEYFSKSSSFDNNNAGYFLCTEDEADKAYLHRFAAAGAAIRYQTINNHKVGELLALDIALRRNDENWVENLPESISSQIEYSLYYGHFMCHVFHQDYILKKGADAKKVKQQLLDLLDSRGAKYPAEHNVGHLYEAEGDLQNFYSELDPTNIFNSGIGGMNKGKRACGCC